MSGSMGAWDDLSEEERGASLKALCDVIAADLFPLSPRIRLLKRALAKLDPGSAPAPKSKPVPTAAAKSYEPSILVWRAKGSRRRARG